MRRTSLARIAPPKLAPAMAPDGDAEPVYTIAAVDRALVLLETLAQEPNSGVTRLAKITGSTKSQVFRLLHTLERRNFVRKDPEARTYVLGLGALVLGDRTRRHADLLRLAAPHLDGLVAATRENVNLIVREGLDTVCIDMRESPQPLRLYAEIGRMAPLHRGGGPKLLLAFAPAEVVEAVLSGPRPAIAGTERASPQSLMRALERIRREGINESYGEIDVDAFSFAAPVRDHKNQVVAALSIAGPTSRLTPAIADRLRMLVIEHAGALSRELAWRNGSVAAGASARRGIDRVRHRSQDNIV